jgi:hypothetical protein
MSDKHIALDEKALLEAIRKLEKQDLDDDERKFLTGLAHHSKELADAFKTDHDDIKQQKLDTFSDDTSVVLNNVENADAKEEASTTAKRIKLAAEVTGMLGKGAEILGAAFSLSGFPPVMTAGLGLVAASYLLKFISDELHKANDNSEAKRFAAIGQHAAEDVSNSLSKNKVVEREEPNVRPTRSP